MSDQPVGVDIEKIKEIDIGLADRIFSGNEMAWLDAAPDKHFRFLEIWTKKEALIKKRGTGLTNNLRLFDVTSASPCERYASYKLGDYIVSICSSYESQEIDFVKITETELIDMWRHLVV